MTYNPENVWVEIYTEVDGVPTWTNIGADVISPITCTLGFSDGDVLSKLAPGSDMRFDLENINSAYNPSSTFYKGQKIRLRIKYGSLLKVKFFGYIDVIKLDPGTWGARQAHVVCIDWLGLAAKTPIRALPSITNTTIDVAIEALLTQMQIQPEALDIEVGNVIMPTVFDQVDAAATVYSELQNLVLSEWGYIYMRDGGMTLKVESSLSRTGDGSDYKTTSYYVNNGVSSDLLLEDGTNFLLEDNTNLLIEGEPTTGTFDSNFGQTYTNLSIIHGDNLVNKISATVTPIIVGGSTVTLYPFSIASGSKALLIPPNTANTPYFLQGQYKDPTAGGAQISGSSIVLDATTKAPIMGTDWTFNSKADGTGTDLSANITMAFTAGQSGFKAIIINSGAAGYLTKFNVRGTAVYRYNPIETVIQDQRSIYDYGDYSLEFTRQYGADSSDVTPFIFRLLMRDRKPRTIFSNPKFDGYDTEKHLTGFLALDIGDQIRLTSTKPASDNLYYIQGVKFTIKPGSEQITFDYVTTETLAGKPEGIKEIAVEQTAIGQAIMFGYIPQISDLQYQTICARFYITNIKNKRLIERYSNDLGFPFSVQMQKVTLLTVDYLQFIVTVPWSSANLVLEAHHPTAGGLLNQWVNLAMTYDSSSGSNSPIVYINNTALVAIDAFSPGSGVRTSEVGSPLTLGNALYHGYPGILSEIKYENIAFYNDILTAADISTIHNGGIRLPFASYPKQNKLKLFFGGMDDAIYTEKLNNTLGTLDTVYDLQNGFSGQLINSPTLRAVG